MNGALEDDVYGMRMSLQIIAETQYPKINVLSYYDEVLGRLTGRLRCL